MERAKHAKELARYVNGTADTFEGAVLDAADWLDRGPMSGPEGEEDLLLRRWLPTIDELQNIKSTVTAELLRAKTAALTAAKWHRRVLPQKSNQWGPATLRAVDDLVWKAREAFREFNWSRRVKSHERARYYVGLLCMKARLLQATDPHQQRQIADVVRKRLKDGALLRQAGEHYPNYTPAKRPDPEKVAAFLARHFKS
jgi:hypothetical protein